MNSRYIKINDDYLGQFEEINYEDKQWYSRPYEFQFMIDSIIEIGSDLTVLDVGTGDNINKHHGHRIFQSLDNIKRLDLLDLSPNLLNKITNAKGEKFVEDLSKFVTPIQYDVILSISMFEHVKDLKEAIDKMYLNLKDGGRLILTLDITKSGHNGHLCNFYKPIEYKQFFEQRGFKVTGNYDDIMDGDCICGNNSKFGPTPVSHHDLNAFRFDLTK